MGCKGSDLKLKPNGSFVPTTHQEIDQLYRELDEAISHLARQGGPMTVAIDTFVTVTGGSRYAASTAHGLVATLIVALAERKDTALELTSQFPGVIVDTDTLQHIESLRAWELWRNLATELVSAMKELDAYLSRALYCARIPQSINQALTRISQEADIRVIDLRKLNIVLDANRPVLLEAADSFHSAIRRVSDVACESIAVLEGLRTPKLRLELLELSKQAAECSIFDPILVMSRFQCPFEALVTRLLDSSKT